MAWSGSFATVKKPDFQMSETGLIDYFKAHGNTKPHLAALILGTG
jgi:hypothetical protein